MIKTEDAEEQEVIINEKFNAVKIETLIEKDKDYFLKESLETLEE